MKKPITPAAFTLINADAAKLIRDDLPAALGEVVHFLEAALPFLRAAEKRAAAIDPFNEQRRRTSKDLHQKIREVAQERKRTRKELQAELTKRGILSKPKRGTLSKRGNPVSIKMISRALNPKK